ncbi:hypothetical protein N186_03960 [Thermofilum adornatum]|uniref:Uncharacterized protein n=1 Tax=Thermofilum adornatum TaxID=1365176 RepID=S5ZKR2_9CREN|nr:hypothetical protein [Thermofilum adornatum]AGT35151.1 hypothetical protein N186_03960 [Thermofilum adornatum]
MRRKVRTVAVSEETYVLLSEFKQRTNCSTFEDAIRMAVELANRAMAMEVLEYVKNKDLSEEEKRVLAEVRGRLREESAWLRR